MSINNVTGSMTRSSGWSQTTTFIVGAGQTVNALQFFEDEASDWTVQFSVIALNPSGLIINCVAKISFAVEGNLSQRQISVVQGASITGVGQGVTVQLIDQTDPALGQTGTYSVTVATARGVRGMSANPPVLTGFEAGAIAIAPGFNAVIANVPQHVGAVSAQVIVVPDPPTLVATAFNVFGQFAGTQTVVWDPRITTGFVTLPERTVVIGVDNSVGTVPLKATILWGIEG